MKKLELQTIGLLSAIAIGIIKIYQFSTSRVYVSKGWKQGWKLNPDTPTNIAITLVLITAAAIILYKIHNKNNKESDIVKTVTDFRFKSLLKFIIFGQIFASLSELYNYVFKKDKLNKNDRKLSNTNHKYDRYIKFGNPGYRHGGIAGVYNVEEINRNFAVDGNGILFVEMEREDGTNFMRKYDSPNKDYIISKDPGFPDLDMQISKKLNVNVTNSEKEEYLNNSSKVNTKLLYNLREEHFKLDDNNNYFEAIKKLTQIIEQIPVLKGQSLVAYVDPSDLINGILLEEIYFNRSQLYSKLNLIDDAKIDLIKAINSKPGRKDPIIHHHLGCAMIQCGDFTSCIEHFNIAIEKDAEYYDSYYMRAVAYSSDKSELTDINKAIDDLNKYLEHDPDDVAALNLLKVLQ